MNIKSLEQRFDPYVHNIHTCRVNIQSKSKRKVSSSKVRVSPKEGICGNFPLKIFFMHMCDALTLERKSWNMRI